ncbi:hypothetical protein WL30_11260 [Burkholderia ubonensis]|nr:hypothetical protein WK60_08200 [Burkholderia ubonensis]KWA73054.1 hypothetical protein WL30_11260 [Burkholderia ubonensis]KWB18301.1 hypothetical protein WL31_11095 [Burkholderia ubonensis]
MKFRVQILGRERILATFANCNGCNDLESLVSVQHDALEFNHMWLLVQAIEQCLMIVAVILVLL